MYLYQITITDKDKPENPGCLDEFTYNVGAKSLPDAIKTAWEKYDLSENFDPPTRCDSNPLYRGLARVTARLLQ